MHCNWNQSIFNRSFSSEI